MTNINNRDYFYLLPKDTVREIKQLNRIDNGFLRLNKFVAFKKIDDTYSLKDKKDLLEKYIRFANDEVGSQLEKITSKYKKLIEALNIKIKVLKLKPEWRIIIGLGNESVYETSITLHHIYGIPYILGSAIKGVTRNYLISEKFDNKEEDALNDQGFCDIFGCPEKSFYGKARKGEVVFFDAFPLTFPRIEVDIMNPHYAPYYSDTSGNTPPADYYDPNPIFFLTVRDTEFEFIIGAKNVDNKEIQKGIFKGEKILNIAFQYMKEALREHGIGAKTAVGYGYME